MRVLVTGATGFAGRALVAALARRGYSVTAGVRDLQSAPSDIIAAMQTGAIDVVAMPDFSRPFEGRPLVGGMDAIVHLAGLAHSSPDIPDTVYHAINCEAARMLAVAAGEAGVQRFIYVSSVRAQCGPCAVGVVSEDDVPTPSDAYGRSKLAGEHAVRDALKQSACAAVVLRPVLMYGPQPKGNMATLARLARLRAPLPLGGLPARRSLLGLANFADAVAFALQARSVAGETYLLADPGPALTVGEIVAALRSGLNRNPAILPIPLPGVQALLRRAGKGNAADRLFGDLVVSTAKLSAAGWRTSANSLSGLAATMSETQGD